MRLINANKIDPIFWNCRSSDDLIIGLYEQILDIPTALTIPDNATNGDMIKTMFPNAIIEINELGSMVHVKYNVNTCWVNYELDWWNAPYNPQQNLSYTDKSGII